jgi:hypothetical protein
MLPNASTGLFLRRGEQVFCESIDDIFATLLRESNSSQTPKQILAPFTSVLNEQECFELLEFAIGEGLLVAGGTSPG